MADQILASAEIKNSENVTCHWDFNYVIEREVTVNDVTKIVANHFCVVVKASEMTDPSDANEAKTKANVKASAIKTAWLANVAAAETPVPHITTPEDVSLT